MPGHPELHKEILTSMVECFTRIHKTLGSDSRNSKRTEPEVALVAGRDFDNCSFTELYEKGLLGSQHPLSIK